MKISSTVNIKVTNIVMKGYFIKYNKSPLMIKRTNARINLNNRILFTYFPTHSLFFAISRVTYVLIPKSIIIPSKPVNEIANETIP